MSRAIRTKVWFKGDEYTITTKPYELHGGLWQDAIRADGKIVTLIANNHSQQGVDKMMKCTELMCQTCKDRVAALVKALEQGACPKWVHNAAVTQDIEVLRAIALWYSDWNNKVRLPALVLASEERP